MSDTPSKISVIIPVYCSEESLEILGLRIIDAIKGIDRIPEIIFVDDASTDGSWNVLQKLKSQHSDALKIVRLLMNNGQHNALLCGLSLVTGDIIVTMDDDLQNPPEEISKLIKAIEDGYDLAIGAYTHKKHSKVRNLKGNIVDTIQRRIFGLPADFQLTSFRAVRRSVIDNVNQMSGAYPYITSMLLANASRYVNVPVRHEERRFGSSNYTLKHSLKLAANLIFSYTSYPIKFTGFACALAFVFSTGFGAWTLYRALKHGISGPGWASTIVIISFFNGLILLSVLVFGFYLMRLSQQTSRIRTQYKIGEIQS